MMFPFLICFWSRLVVTFWSILLLLLSSSRVLVQADTLCTQLTASNPGLQALSPSGDLLYLIFKDTAYSVPFTDTTINDSSGRFTIAESSLKYLGNWTNVSWLAPLASEYSQAQLLYAKLDIISSTTKRAHVQLKMPDREVPCLFKYNVDDAAHKPACVEGQSTVVGTLATGTSEKVFILVAVGNGNATKETRFILSDKKSQDNQFHVILGAEEVVFYTTTGTPPEKLPKPKYALSTKSSPIFGFIHLETVHLWLPGDDEDDNHTMVILLFADPRPRLGEVAIPTEGLRLKLKAIPIGQYFACSESTEMLTATWVWISGAVLVLVITAVVTVLLTKRKITSRLSNLNLKATSGSITSSLKGAAHSSTKQQATVVSSKTSTSSAAGTVLSSLGVKSFKTTLSSALGSMTSKEKKKIPVVGSKVRSSRPTRSTPLQSRSRSMRKMKKKKNKTRRPQSSSQGKRWSLTSNKRRPKAKKVEEEPVSLKEEDAMSSDDE